MLTKEDIIVYVPVYQDKLALNNCLNYLEDLGLKALVVDGRFTDFPQINNSDHSTDGTMEMAKSRGHHYHKVQPCREEIKLNYALDVAFQLGYTVFMYIGADAYLKGDIDEFLVSLQRHYERFVIDPTMLQIEAVELRPNDQWNNTGSRQPRVLLNFNDMEARHLHWVMYRKGDRDDNPLHGEQIVIDGLKIYHDNKVRPQERDDLMTAYQNKNVPRERESYRENVAKKVHAEIRILIWIEDKAGSYSKARETFKTDKYSHMIFVKKGNYITKDTVKQFHAVVKEHNTVLNNIPVYTAVWDAKKGRITLDPKEQYTEQLPNYLKVRELYSVHGTVPTSKLMGIPWTAGPILCLDARVVHLIDNMGDDLDFMTFCNKLDLSVMAITEIRV